MKQGPLYDAARMLRLAAKRIEEFADTDAATTYETAGTMTSNQRRLIHAAVANIDAAMARIHAYSK